MKIDIASLTYEEVAFIIRRLQRMNMDANVSRMGHAVTLNVEPQTSKAQEAQLGEITDLF